MIIILVTFVLVQLLGYLCIYFWKLTTTNLTSVCYPKCLFFNFQGVVLFYLCDVCNIQAINKGGNLNKI